MDRSWKLGNCSAAFPQWDLDPLQPDLEQRWALIEHLKKPIETIELLEVPVIGTFVGKDKNKTVPQNF
jgi:hypothetical protein